MVKKARAQQAEERMSQIRADFERANSPDCRAETALSLFPKQHHADALTRIESATVTLETIYARLGLTPESMHTLISQKHMAAANNYMSHLKQGSAEDMVGFYLSNVRDHFEGAGFKGKFAEAFTAAGVSRETLEGYVKRVYTLFCGKDSNNARFQEQARKGEEKFAEYFPS